ncbi:APC family permease [Tetragenococcus koreensis]|uniref:Amino acid permease n=1 Tax=Tetragenococcus koreensis TaxID=290335 RepID=A0AAN4ZSI7_9ENTE|nr:APC family permease [Tetragenococcus koreensis]GEQ49642.1 amino acid permease [Tetragenococcus koreensis]GEQ52088.1 amino acid permease [Tetragenococcus koreensis]GEQ54623.1 amino acid permease [Tetragenococcus koreensis]GEQ57097.1 amino acid permease [Tetragenococcus koreensis]GEQ59655.1 amino acid permease [Tetragenococcus koreensis]
MQTGENIPDSSEIVNKKKLGKVAENAKFGLGGAVLYGINAVVGSGIFLLPKDIYMDLGPFSLIAMLVDVLLVMLLAVCFAEVSGYFDKNGGAFQYSKTAFGNLVGFNVGLLGWFVTIAAWAAMAAGFSRLLIQTFPSLEGRNVLISVLLVLALSVINTTGIKTSKIFTITITIAKLVPIIAFTLVAVFFVKHGIDVGNFTPFVQLNPDMSMSQAMASTSLTVFYAFIGFEAMPIVAGEMRNPKKNVPKAIVSSISIVSLLYFLIIGGTIAMLGTGILQSNAPVQDAFVQMVGPAGKWIISIGALISILGLNMGDSLMIPRYGASISDEGLLPKVIAKQNSKGAPYVAIITSAVITIALLFSGSFEQLAELSVVFRFIQYIPTALAVIWLRKKDMPNIPSFKVPFGPVIPIIAVIVSIWMVAAADLTNLIAGAIGIVVATVMYFIINGKKKDTTES